jgi:GxxExxY protein
MADEYVKSEYEQSDITARIIAAAIQVHRNLGPGFEEVIYQRALALELQSQGLGFSREVWIDVHYRGMVIGRKRVDFMIEGVMVEIKAYAELQDVHFVQALSYLKASGCKIGLLLNFGAPRIQIKRLAN